MVSPTDGIGHPDYTATIPLYLDSTSSEADANLNTTEIRYQDDSVTVLDPGGLQTRTEIRKEIDSPASHLRSWPAQYINISDSGELYLSKRQGWAVRVSRHATVGGLEKRLLSQFCKMKWYECIKILVEYRTSRLHGNWSVNAVTGDTTFDPVLMIATRH